MARRRKFKKGTYKVRCDRSGAIFNSCDMRMTWDGLYVHKSLWYPKHPQDSVTTVPNEGKPPPIVRAEGAESFLSAGEVTADDL